MQIRWVGFSQKSRARLNTGWLITAGLVALYLGAIEPLENAREINYQKAAGLAPAMERRSFSFRSPNRLRASEAWSEAWSEGCLVPSRSRP